MTDNKLDEILSTFENSPKFTHDNTLIITYDKARTQINQYIYETILGLVGEDEPMKTKRSDKWASSAPYKRNQLRAEIRLKAKRLLNG